MSFSQNPVVYLTSKLWKYSKGRRRNVVLYFSLFVAANAVSFLSPLVIAAMLDVIQKQGITQASLPLLYTHLAQFFGLTVAFWMFHGPARVIENRNAYLVLMGYKQYLLDGVMAFPLEWHNEHHSGDTIDKIDKGTKALYNYSSNTFQVIETIVRLVSSYFALCYFNIHSAYIVFGMIVVTIFCILKFDAVLIKEYEKLFLKENKVSERIFDVISNITTVVILRIERLISSSLRSKMQEPFSLFHRNSKINETKWFLVSMCGVLMTVFVLGSYFGMELRIGGAILIGTVYILYDYVNRINELFFRFAWMYGDMVQQTAAVRNAEAIANTFGDLRETRKSALPSKWKTLRIEGLTFSYHSTEGADLHLDNVSLDLYRGERIALIGSSGSGKTTFLKLVRELYRPQQVHVLLDGRMLKEGFRSISSDISLIPQDPEIFSTTIGENITVGVERTQAAIKRFTDLARFTDVVKRLPHGLASSIFEKGVNLSGGEKQRLALARGLMASEDKQIILLDEPTSSMDTRNEWLIFQNIFRAFKGKTIVASVHRLHLLRLFDRIVFFSQGKIIATGTLAELLASSQEFKELWQKYQDVKGGEEVS